MNQNKELKLSYSYDIEVDAIFINTVDNYDYDQSIEFESGIIMDFDNKGKPVALEILDISQLFCFEKRLFKNITDISLKIKIDSCIYLDLKMGILLENRMVHYNLNKAARNYLNSQKGTYFYCLTD